jgi:hypothetical protein
MRGDITQYSSLKKKRKKRKIKIRERDYEFCSRALLEPARTRRIMKD